MIKTVEINNFPTHVWLSRSKSVKVNGQSIYSGVTNRFSRAKIVEDLREKIKGQIPKDLILTDLLPCQITLEWHVVPNYHTVKMKPKSNFQKFQLGGGNITPNTFYDPKFDVDNQWMWIKIFTDVISKDLKLIPEDTVKYIPKNGTIEFHPVDHIDKMKLVYRIEKISDERYLESLRKYFNYDE